MQHAIAEQAALRAFGTVADGGEGGLKLVELADGATEAELRAATEATLIQWYSHLNCRSPLASERQLWADCVKAARLPH